MIGKVEGDGCMGRDKITHTCPHSLAVELWEVGEVRQPDTPSIIDRANAHTFSLSGKPCIDGIGEGGRRM